MGNIYDNGIILATGFKLDDPRPLDDKDIVATFNDLLTLEYAYEGITVKVQDEDYAAYTWVTGDQSTAANWHLIGGGGGADTTAIHIDVAGEFLAAPIKAPVHATDLLLIEDNYNANNKKYIQARSLGIMQTVFVSSVTTSGTTVYYGFTGGSRIFNVSGSCTNFTISLSTSINDDDVTFAYAMIYNQRTENITVNLQNVDQFEGDLTDSIIVAPGYTRIELMYFRGVIFASYAVGSGSGNVSRPITEVSVTTDAANQTVDMSVSEVVIYKIASGLISGSITPTNLSSVTEQRNKVIFDNRNNTSGFVLGFDTVGNTIDYCHPINDFPGIFPSMNIAAGTYWEIEFENESDTIMSLYFAQKEFLT